MLTLIEREFRDHIVYFVAGILFSIIIIGSLFSSRFTEFEEIVVVLVIPMIFIVLFGAAAMGAGQMYSDRSNKVTSFLSTLAVNRAHILTARCLVGVAVILVPFVSITAVVVVLLGGRFPLLPVYSGTIRDVASTAFLLTFSCYCIGLLCGWTTNKFLPAFGCLLFPLVAMMLVVVKGFGVETMAVLMVVILASLVCIWVRFSSTPL